MVGGAGRGGTGWSGGLGEGLVDLASIFEPANRHLAAERRRQKTNRRQAGQGAPPFELELDTGPGRFSGTYRLPAAGRSGEEAVGRDTTDAGTAADDTGTTGTGTSDTGTADTAPLTPAAGDSATRPPPEPRQPATAG